MASETISALDAERAARNAPPYFIAALDRFVSPRVKSKGGEELLRARLTVVVGFGGASALAIGILVAQQTPDPAITYFGYLLTGLFIAAPAFQRFDLKAELMRHILVAAVAVNSIALFSLTGGRDIGGILLAIMVPLIAVTIAGYKCGITWTGILFLSLIATGTAVQLGYEPPLPVDSGAEALWSLWACAATLITSLAIALGYDRLRQNTLQLAESERLRADRAHAEQLETEAKFRNQLESLVEERSKALHESEAKLRQADRLATIGTLAAGVAHQINNPVGSILISAQFALGSGGEPNAEQTYREALEANADNAKRVGNIVRDLLAFSRDNESEKSPLDLNEIIRTAISTFDQDSSRFELSLTDQSLPILGSAIELEQVVVNLVQNALESGHPTDRPLSIASDLRGDHATLRVCDEGRGIDPELRERIFDPFFTTRIEDGGTGLGLSLAHGIIENHDGQLEIESEVGRGTEVLMRIRSRRG